VQNDDFKRWTRWTLTAQGRQCLDYLTLKIARKRQKFLRNRLYAAWKAGMEAGRQAALKEQEEKQCLFARETTL
jgi:hypothetical protein